MKNNNKQNEAEHIQRSKSVRIELWISTAAIAFAPSLPILLPPIYDIMNEAEAHTKV